jgi:hypothetical protein
MHPLPRGTGVDITYNRPTGVPHSIHTELRESYCPSHLHVWGASTIVLGGVAYWNSLLFSDHHAAIEPMACENDRLLGLIIFNAN